MYEVELDSMKNVRLLNPKNVISKLDMSKIKVTMQLVLRKLINAFLNYVDDGNDVNSSLKIVLNANQYLLIVLNSTFFL